MGRRPRSKTPFSTGTQRAHSAFRGPPVRTRLRRTHSVFRAYGGGHGSKRQRLHPPLHREKSYKSEMEVLCPIHRGRSAKADGKVIRLQVPSLRHKQARSGRTASFAPTAGATAANGNDCILRSTGESPTEADGKPYYTSTKAGEKVCKMGSPFPAA